jgi:hypothetical protein
MSPEIGGLRACRTYTHQPTYQSPYSMRKLPRSENLTSHNRHVSLVEQTHVKETWKSELATEHNHRTNKV